MTSAPCSRSARRVQLAVAELERRAHRLQPGDVHVDRAGAEVVAAGHRQAHPPQRVSSGPSTLIEARIRSTSSYGATGDELAAVASSRSRPGDRRRDVTPIAASSSPMIDTSTMSGTLVSSYSPSARRLAAISLSTEFLAPGTSIVPSSWPTRRTRDLPPGSVMRDGRCDRRTSRGTGPTSVAWPRQVSSRPTSMLPPCWQAVTRRTPRPLRPPARRRADVARRPRRRRQPRAAPRRPRAERAAGRRRLVRAGRRTVHSIRRDASSRRARRRPSWRETTTYRWSIPWFAWLFALPLRWTLARRVAAPTQPPARRPAATPWWAPPDRLDPRDAQRARTAGGGVDVVGVHQHAVHPDRRVRGRRLRRRRSGVGIAGAVVRAGIVLVLPVAAVADRIGRRRDGDRRGRSPRPLVTALGAAGPDVPAPRRHPGARPPARAGARLHGGGRRRRGDAAELAGLRGERAGDGQRARRRGGGHRAPLADLSAGSWRSSTSSP